MKRIIIATLVVPALAHGEPRLELGGSFGGHAFSHSTELGANDDILDSGPSSSSLFGARLAYVVIPRLAIEGELTVMPTKEDVLGDHVIVYGLGAHVRFDLLQGAVRPFVVAGFGANVLRTSSPQMRDDVDQAYHWGLGVRWAMNERVDLRIDGRQEIVPDRTHNGATSDFEAMVGATYRFGQISHPLPPPFVVEAPRPTPPVVEPPQPEPIKELAGISFQLDSAVILIDSAPILERAYDLLATHPKLSIEISGHTSSEGDADRNLSLSLARAEAVKAYLVQRGIEGARIQTVGHGADVPVADNTTEDGRRKNRRIEFHILDAGQ